MKTTENYGLPIIELDDYYDIEVWNNLNKKLDIELKKINSSIDSSSKEVESFFTSVSNGKSLIARTITDKGVYTSDKDSFETISKNISQINNEFSQAYKTSNILAKTLKIPIGTTTQIRVIPEPCFFKNNSTVWSSSNSTIATIDSNGTITAIALGTATITANNPFLKYTHTCTVEVIQPTEVFENIAISDSLWEKGGFDWSGNVDDTKTNNVRTKNYVAIEEGVLKFVMPSGCVYSYINFFSKATDGTINALGGQYELVEDVATTEGQEVRITTPKYSNLCKIQIFTWINNAGTYANSLAKAKLLKMYQVKSNVPKYYDNYINNNVAIASKTLVLYENDSYNLITESLPIKSNTQLNYSSSDTNVATINNSGLINALKDGVCVIKISNSLGTYQECVLTVKKKDTSGTAFVDLKSSLVNGENANGDFKQYNIDNIVVEDNFKTSFIKNCNFVGSNNTSANRFYIIDNSDNIENNIIFENCSFDNCGIGLGSYKGTIIFRNCSFKNWKVSPVFIDVYCSGANVIVENSRLYDNSPPTTEWINNSSKERFWKYSVVNFFGNDNKLTFRNNTVTNIMARCIIYVNADKTGNELNITNNTFYKTEGHVIAMESSCKGIVFNNSFYFVGALRNTIGNTDPTNGVGGNCVFASPTYITCPEMIVSNNIIKYAMENGIEGSYKEISYNYIENTGYRLSDGLDNPSMEGIWGSAINGIHHNIIVNTNMSGIRCSEHLKLGDITSYVTNNIILYNSTIVPKELRQAGISVVSNSNCNKNVFVRNNTIIGYIVPTRIDKVVEYTSFDIQTTSELSNS